MGRLPGVGETKERSAWGGVFWGQMNNILGGDQLGTTNGDEGWRGLLLAGGVGLLIFHLWGAQSLCLQSQETAGTFSPMNIFLRHAYMAWVCAHTCP